MTKQDVIAAKCVADTLWATRYFFKSEYGRKFNVGEHHKKMAALLDEVLQGKHRKVMINVPPRYSKTEMIKALVKKGLAINPASQYLMLSYSDNLALENSENIRDAVNSDWYREIFPWVEIKKDSKAKKKWKTTAGGAVYAASAGGQITGFGAGLVREEIDEDGDTFEIKQEDGKWGGCIIIDDPLKPLDAESPVMREKVNYNFDNTIRSRVNDERTPIIIIMQRLHKQDLCGYLLAKEPDEWTVLSLPALSTDENGNEVALYPFKHTVEALHKLRDANRFVFDTQYQQDPHAINEKLWLFAFDRDKHTGHVEYDPNQPLVMSWDFNKNPMTCTLFQHVGNQVRGIECFRIENATTRMVCQEIHKKYPHAFWLVTGDVAGKNANTVSLLNNYDVIKAYFDLSRSQMQYSGNNPSLAFSRNFMNSLFEQYDIVFDKDKCKPAIFDFENVMSDDENKPVKTSRDNVAQQADFLDNVRYYFHRFYKELIPNY